MRYLSIVWYKVLPPKFGGQKGIAFFNTHLSQYHPLACLCSRNNEPSDDIPYTVIPELPLSRYQFIWPSTWWKIIQKARMLKPTHLILEHPYHGVAGFLACHLTNSKLVVHSHNIEFLRFKKEARWWWPLLRVYEKWVHRTADLNLFKTEKDLDFALQQFNLHRDKCALAPYGVEKPSAFPSREEARQIIGSKHGIPDGALLFLFAGTLDYKPNAEAVQFIYSEIVPLLRPAQLAFKIIICGRNQFPSFQYLREIHDEDVIYAGEVEDIEVYFRAADAFINPVLKGGGVQTKIIDALSFGCNVVCFETVLEGIYPEVFQEKLFTAKNQDWGSFVRQMEKAGTTKAPLPQQFFDYFNWDKTVAAMLDKLDPDRQAPLNDNP